MQKNTIEINKKKYNYKLFDTAELLELIRHNKPFIKLLEDAIKIYRNYDKFVINDLINEYITSKSNSITKYSIIYKKNVIVSTCRFIYDKKLGYFNLVYVNPEYRNQQICQNHIQHIINLFKSKLHTYELSVLKNNISALKCYENIGFKKIKDNNREYIMRLKATA
jgi:ribosomal protein S18 acetylase RimI-like enzyme